jgi:hypothetical protein
MINLEQPHGIDKERGRLPFRGGRREGKGRRMAALAMLLGMVTLMDVTMAGALMSLAGNIPDRSLLHIFSRYLRKKGEPAGALLHPWEVASRLARLRRAVLGACVAAAVVGVGFTMWALSAAWGAPAMLAITFWVLAGNFLFDSIPLASWRRRAILMKPDAEAAGPDAGGSPPARGSEDGDRGR